MRAFNPQSLGNVSIACFLLGKRDQLVSVVSDLPLARRDLITDNTRFALRVQDREASGVLLQAIEVRREHFFFLSCESVISMIPTVRPIIPKRTHVASIDLNLPFGLHR